MSDKKTHFGRAGEYFAMSELLLRGWNVTVPVVDVGDDVFIIDDRDKATRRVQVKTSAAELLAGGRLRAKFQLSRAQLRLTQPIELFYMLLVRAETRWRLLVIPRVDLLRIRDAPPAKPGRGAPRKSDEAARVDELTLTIEFAGDAVTGWGASLDPYLDRWPEDIWIVEGGPGSVGEPGASGAGPTPAAGPAPSPSPGRPRRRRA